MERSELVAVVPAGAFGTAMGILAARNGYDVALYIPRKETLDTVMSTNEHPKLPGIELPSTMTITGDPEEALEGRGTVVFAAPSHVAKRFGEEVARYSDVTEQHVLSLTKGLHVTASDEVMVYTKMLRTLNSDLKTAAESGPNFAEVVASGKERVRTVIASEEDLGYGYEEIFTTDMFLPELTHDEIGTQVSGAAKNVIALGKGICEGAGVASEVLERLVEKQGPLEMAKLIILLGGREETAYGIAGVDDLRLTCTMGSRNHRAGVRLGAKKKIPQELVYEAINYSKDKDIVEGVHAANAVRLLLEQHEIELPVMSTVAAVLFENMRIDEAVQKIQKSLQ